MILEQIPVVLIPPHLFEVKYWFDATLLLKVFFPLFFHVFLNENLSAISSLCSNTVNNWSHW